jgi:hypothetical protein
MANEIENTPQMEEEPNGDSEDQEQQEDERLLKRKKKTESSFNSRHTGADKYNIHKPVLQT